MAKTKIEWAEAVWNPTIGCRRVSEGCRNCYAERMAARLVGMGRREYEDVLTSTGRWAGNVKLLEERLGQPLSWKKPRRVFVDSMSDLFHEDVPFEFIDEVFAVMGRSQQHTFMILTKRPERMYEYFQEPARYQRIMRWAFKIDAGPIALTDAQIGSGISDPVRFPWPNVWLGVSVENQQMAARRIPWLVKTPAAVKFISVEPMLGPLNLMGWLMNCPTCGEYLAIDAGWEDASRWRWNGERWEHSHGYPHGHVENVPAPLIDWVICGGESGVGARPMHPDWARSLRDECQAGGVPFFFKQWGEFAQVSHTEAMATREWHNMGMPPRVVMFGPAGSTVYMKRVGKKAAGNLLDGKKWEEWPDGR